MEIKRDNIKKCLSFNISSVEEAKGLIEQGILPIVIKPGMSLEDYNNLKQYYVPDDNGYYHYISSRLHNVTELIPNGTNERLKVVKDAFWLEPQMEGYPNVGPNDGLYITEEGCSFPLLQSIEELIEENKEKSI